MPGENLMRFTRGVLLFVLLSSVILPSRTRAQTGQKLTAINYGNIVLSASNWPFFIAEQEGFFVREGIDFKRVVGGNTTVPIYTLIVHPSIKSYADLKGKRLAVTGPTDPLNYILARMLAANGLGPTDYEMIGLGGAPQRMAAV